MGVTKIKYQPGSAEDVEQKEKLARMKPFHGKAKVGTGTITPRSNAKKIESNAKKIEKLMGMMKGK